VTLDEILAQEARTLGRPIYLVGTATVAHVTLVIYDCKPLDHGDLGAMYERRYAVVGPMSRTSGTVSSDFK
jgi:hypothetical protein